MSPNSNPSPQSGNAPLNAPTSHISKETASGMNTVVNNMEDLLEASAAAPEFKNAVRALAEGRSQDRILHNSGTPKVKALRAALKLLEERPADPIESIVIHGRSGCSDFVGDIQVKPSGQRIIFEWDCQWRAKVMGWLDVFGEPDQMRAAQSFGYQCFRRFDQA